MTERETGDSESNRDRSERYSYAEYEAAEGSVFIIQDTQNERAWVQATHAVAVER